MVMFRGLLTILSVSMLVSCVSLDYVFPTNEKVVTQSSDVKMSAIDRSDADADGIPDWADLCEETKTGVRVDTAGCELITGIIEGLKFAPDEVELTLEAESVIDRYVAAFKLYPETDISVEGHTDNRGSAAENLELSKQRVNAVVVYMVDEGIAAERIKPFAFGENRPVASNATLPGREQNRRIEINLIERLL